MGADVCGVGWGVVGGGDLLCVGEACGGSLPPPRLRRADKLRWRASAPAPAVHSAPLLHSPPRARLHLPSASPLPPCPAESTRSRPTRTTRPASAGTRAGWPTPWQPPGACCQQCSAWSAQCPPPEPAGEALQRPRQGVPLGPAGWARQRGRHGPAIWRQAQLCLAAVAAAPAPATAAAAVPAPSGPQAPPQGQSCCWGAAAVQTRRWRV